MLGDDPKSCFHKGEISLLFDMAEMGLGKGRDGAM